MSDLEQAAAAAVASYERCGKDWDGFCKKMKLLGEALAAHKEQAEQAESHKQGTDAASGKFMTQAEPNIPKLSELSPDDKFSGNPSY